MPKISVDTNILINDSSILFDTTKEFVISFQVLRELDKLKRNPDLKRSAQIAIKNVKALLLAGKLEILNVPTKESLGDSPDELILLDTLVAGASFLSEDINATVIATALNIPLSDVDAEADTDYGYKGYITIEGGINYDQNYVQVKELPLDEFNEIFGVSLKENQYCIIDRVGDKNDIWVNHRGIVSRISQSAQPLKSAGIMEVPLDYEQACAIHAIMDPSVPLTIIDGKVGSGKSLLALMGALACTIGQRQHQHYKSIFVTRPPVGINSAYKLGYLPGDLNAKLGDWLGGIKSNLKFLLDKNFKRNKETDIAPSEEVFQDHFELINLDSIQGMSLHDGILLVDEYQLTDRDMLKLILTRISKGSKVVLMGDTVSQTFGINRLNEGYRAIYPWLGQIPEMSFIRLENIHRSALVKVIDKMFND